MKKITKLFLLFALLLLSDSHNRQNVNVLVVYYSVEGHTKTLAEAVAHGARSVNGVNVKLLPVDKATSNEVLAADAMIIGSPVYNANVAPPVQTFINNWPFDGAPLRDKIGAAFVTA